MTERIAGKRGMLTSYPSRSVGTLRDYLTSPLPTPPASFDYAKLVKGSFPMACNDTLGCCTISGVIHLLQLAYAVVGKDFVYPGDADVRTTYLDLTGGVDSGLVETTVLQRWQTHGLFGVKALAWAPIDIRDTPLLSAACYAFGGLYLGGDIPQDAETQFEDGQWWTLEPGNNPPVGGHCVSPDTKVLTDTLLWVPIGDLLPGDRVVSFDEMPPGPKKARRFRAGIVEATEHLRLPCYELEFEDGTTVTASEDHQWLVGGQNASSNSMQWITTENLEIDKGWVPRMLPTWETDRSWEAGYLAGAYDGEGWLDSRQDFHRIGFDQRYNEMLDEVIRCLKDRGFDFDQSTAKSGFADRELARIKIPWRQESTRFLGQIRPLRLLEKFHPEMLGTVRAASRGPGVGQQHQKIVRKTPVGVQEVVALQTDTGTYLAEGLASHNCFIGSGSSGRGIPDITWGAEDGFTWNWWAQYGTNAYVVIPEIFAKVDHGPLKSIDLKTLQADLAKI